MKEGKIDKMVGSLDRIIAEIDKMAFDNIEKDSEKYKLLSNLSFDLHQIAERLDEFNLNQK